MVFKNSEAFNSLEVLSEANEKGKLGFAIAKNRRKFLDELTEFCEMRETLARKYGEVLPDGRFTIDNDKFADFVDELKPYGEIECDIPIMRVNEETFISGTLTSQQMFVLEWMIEDENEKQKEGS